MLNEKELIEIKKILNGKEEKLSIIFNALSDPKRCQIFRLFLKREKLCVSDIAKIIGISLPSASQHLKILETNGLILKEKKGREKHYYINHNDFLIKAIIKVVK